MKLDTPIPWYTWEDDIADEPNRTFTTPMPLIENLWSVKNKSQIKIQNCNLVQGVEVEMEYVAYIFSKWGGPAF